MSDHERAQLTNWFEEHMGTELGDAMKALPPVGWGDIATRRDLQFLEQTLAHKIDMLGQRLDALAESMTDSMTSIRGQMATKADLAAARVDLQRTLITWIFAAQAAVVAAVGVLLAYLR